MKHEESPEGENLESVGGEGVDNIFVPDINTETNEENVETVEAVEEYEQEEEPSESEITTAISEIQHSLSTLPSTSSYSEVGEAAEALSHMTALANVLIKGKLSPLKKPEDIIIAIITGKQYNMPFISCINNIYPINGKPTMSTHLIRGLILKNKIIFKKIYDYEPMYFYYKAEMKEGKLELVVVAGNYVAISKGTKNDIPDELNIRGSKVVDYITKYSFRRKIQMPDNTWETLEVESSFKWSDAAKADLVKKDNWKNHPARMLDSRAFNIGAKEIADDIIGGMYSVNELADAFGVNYTISDNMEERVIQQ